MDSKINVLNHTDPNRIYVENIRSFYNLPHSIAKFICEVAVREGVFTKKYGIECPNDNRIIMTSDKATSFPEIIKCETCELLERERSEFLSSECHVTEFYKLNV